MGKIRVKTLGDESLEEEQKKEAHKRKEARLAESRQAKRTAKAPGLKGGQRVVAVGPTEEELKQLSVSENLSGSVIARETSNKKTATTRARKKSETQKKAKPSTPRPRSKRYKTVAAMVDKKKQYKLSEALELLPRLKLAKFDETVELHINTTEPGLTGQLNLPHGTGKKMRVAIADPSAASGQAQIDELIKNIEKGIIDFDVLIAHPAAMPKLAKVAKVLGPKGLMPNPKNGTITANPETEVKKYEGGQMSYKTETKLPVVHLTVGKISFGEKKLSENIKIVFAAIQTEKIKNATLKSTMSPGIRIDFATIS